MALQEKCSNLCSFEQGCLKRGFCGRNEKDVRNILVVLPFRNTQELFRNISSFQTAVVARKEQIQREFKIIGLLLSLRMTL